MFTILTFRSNVGCGDDGEKLEGIDDRWQCRVGSSDHGVVVLVVAMMGFPVRYGVADEVLERVRELILLAVGNDIKLAHIITGQDLQLRDVQDTNAPTIS